MAEAHAVPVRADPERGLWGFAGWALVGGLLSLGVLALLSIGVFLVAAGAVLAVVLLMRPVGRGIARWGLVSGLGLPLLYVALLNREGPGEVCHRNSDGVKCEEMWSPWPFLAVGALLLVGGVVAYLLASRRGQSSSPPGFPATPERQ